jgi:CRISPR/Cas system-associated protein Csm6
MMAQTDDKAVVLCTVGTTALFAEDLLEDGSYDLANQMREYSGYSAKQQLDFARHHKLHERVLPAHHAFWKEVKAGRMKVRLNNMKRTSAEMTSSLGLCKGSKAGLNRMLDPGKDRVVFLTPDNPNGRWAAEINAELAAMYLFEPGPGTDVHVEVVKGLEGSGPDFGRIGPELKAIFAKHTDGYLDIRVNFTGGYKGAIPAIVWACNQVPMVRMFYQHEQMNEICLIDLQQGSDPVNYSEQIPS